MNDLVPTNLNKSHGLAVSWLETNRGASCDIQSVTISFDTIKFELWVSLYEMVMRPDLD